jgi:hypothetical protein
MATFDDGTTIDDSGSTPGIIAGPTVFTGTAKAASSDLAEELAKESARSNAFGAYGIDTTQFVGVDDLYVKIVGDEPPFMYEATFKTQAVQVSTEQTYDVPEEQEDGEDPPEDGGGDAEYDPYADYIEYDTPPEVDPEEDPFEKARQDAEDRYNEETPNPEVEEETQEIVVTAQRPAPAAAQPATPPDWRLRISLAPGANYLYKARPAGILQPLVGTDGVIFPYTPTVSVAYAANYESTSITHSNYKIHNYQGSSVDNVQITGDFTAQDAAEANYMLAVIHFFRSCTKMFYGQDTNPSRGVPPPMLYLTGFGQYQFDRHPMVLTSFTYSLPNDVDYINAYPNGVGGAAVNGAQLRAFDLSKTGTGTIRSAIEGAAQRVLGNGLSKILGIGTSAAQTMTGSATPGATASMEVTRVPTKIQLSITLTPMISRYAMSNEFSLKEYANGNLLRGSQNPKAGGGVW